jgi:N-methylhydantoinase A
LILGIGRIEGRFGVDIRDFVILAYGGAGPTHACILADQIGIRRVIVPLSPGTFCALGSLCADFRSDFVQTVNEPLGRPNWEAIARWYADKEAEAACDLKEEAGLIESVVALRSVDCRYEGQGFNTEVAIADDVLRTQDAARLSAAFHKKYEQLYGVAQSTVPGEVVNLRLTMIGKRRIKPGKTHAPSAAAPRPTASRSVFFDGQRKALPVYRRTELGSGATLEGPCVVDQKDTTIFVRPNWHAEVDSLGVIHLQRS